MFADVSSRKDIIDLRDSLNEFVFYGLEKYKVGTILTVPLYSIDNEQINNLDLLKYIVKVCFCWNYKIEKGRRLVFFKSVDYFRARNYQEMYDKLISSVQYGSVIEPIRKNNINVHIFKYIVFFLRAYRIIKKLYGNSQVVFFLTLHLVKAYIELDKFVKLYDECGEKRIVVTFCDVHPVDAIITQYVNICGGISVTLQHGHFNALDRGWVFNQSKSKYFLLHGEYAKQQAILSEHINEGLVPVGMLNFIGMERSDVNIDLNNPLFALILNGPGANEDNVGLIECANKFAEEHNMKYVIRSHPAISLDTFNEYILKKYMFGISESSENIKLLLDRVQFVMVGNSTVFIESLYLGRLTLRHVGRCVDIYDSVTWCRFRNFDELNEIYNSISKNQEELYRNVSNTVSLLCKDGNIEENYCEFFRFVVGGEY